MNKKKKKLTAILLAVLVLALLLAGCGGGRKETAAAAPAYESGVTGYGKNAAPSIADAAAGGGAFYYSGDVEFEEYDAVMSGSGKDSGGGDGASARADEKNCSFSDFPLAKPGKV